MGTELRKKREYTWKEEVQKIKKKEELREEEGIKMDR